LTVAARGLVRPWWTQKRWWVAILLCVVTLIGYVDRLALSVAAPVIRREFGFTNEQYGFITFAFLATYAAGQLLLGPVIDRLGSKRSLSLAVFWWSVASCLQAFARGLGGFFAARSFLGFAEAVNLPAAYKVVAEWFPRAERSMASGLITAGIGLGAIVAPPLIAFLIGAFCTYAASRQRRAGRRRSSCRACSGSHGCGRGGAGSTCPSRTPRSPPTSVRWCSRNATRLRSRKCLAVRSARRCGRTSADWPTGFATARPGA